MASLNRDLQGKITELFRSLVAAGKERGLQVAVYHRGELVLDAWAGTLSEGRGRGGTTGVGAAGTGEAGREVDGETLFPVFSTGKGITATVIHWLVERGQLAYDTRVAEVWPEFAAQGKGGIMVRHVLGHTAGLAQVPVSLPAKTLHDWDAMCDLLAKAKPAHGPGECFVYHAMTFGWILGEVAKRVDGRDFVEIVRQEMGAPLGIQGMYFGIPDGAESRVAVIEEPPAEAPKGPAGDMAATPASSVPHGEWMNRPEARRACIPASNGIMNARSIARHYAALVPGGVDGVELLPLERIRKAMEPQPAARSLEGNMMPTRLGYIHGGPEFIVGDPKSAFGHYGYGGSIGYGDIDNRFAVGFARNRFHEKATPTMVMKEIRGILGIG